MIPPKNHVKSSSYWWNYKPKKLPWIVLNHLNLRVLTICSACLEIIKLMLGWLVGKSFPDRFRQLTFLSISVSPNIHKK